MTGMIPIYDPAPQYDSLREPLEQTALRVLCSGRYILGEEVAAFERAAAEYLGTRHAIGVNSGTDALMLGLAALGVGPGDEVITSPFTFFATAEAISQLGAEPRFVDIDPDTFNLDLNAVETAITERTRCVLPVHLYGRALDMTGLNAIAHRHELTVLEDCAQSFGARHQGTCTGSLGDVGAYSFYPTKNLGGFGDGGLITAEDDAVAQRCRSLRDHGNQGNYRHELLGFNSRLDALQAALLAIKLPHIDEWNAMRRAVAARYQEQLGDVSGIEVPATIEDEGHVYHQYTIRIKNGRRDEVFQRLRDAGIGVMLYYPLPLHQQPVYRHLDLQLPHAEQAAAEALSLPIWPHLDAATQDRVSAALRAALSDR